MLDAKTCVRLVYNKFLGAMGDPEEELFLTQTTAAFPALWKLLRGRWISFMNGTSQAHSQDAQNSVSDLFDFKTPEENYLLL